MNVRLGFMIQLFKPCYFNLSLSLLYIKLQIVSALFPSNPIYKS